jgi:hypothetical protein
LLIANFRATSREQKNVRLINMCGPKTRNNIDNHLKDQEREGKNNSKMNFTEMIG